VPTEQSIEVVRSADRGHLDHGWLDTYHTFSFGEYHDPARMGYRSLRVMNEDWVAPKMGFGRHGHRDMEIVTYVLEGTLEHGDSLGHSGPIRAGELQRMTAGTGILHSERNGSDSEPVHLYQIWLLPDRDGREPGYEQKAFDPSGRRGRWQVVASPDGRDGSLSIHQDATIALAGLEAGQSVDLPVAAGRHAWLQVIRGSVRLDGQTLAAGDAATFTGGSAGAVEGADGAEVMLFDLA